VDGPGTKDCDCSSGTVNVGKAGEPETVESIIWLGCGNCSNPTDTLDDLDTSESKLVSTDGSSAIDGSVFVRPSMRFATGWLGLD
jgi:hypothetical protein